MRIRKRQVPFPVLPATHSDPNLINRSPVMVQLNDATKASSCTHHHGSTTTAPSPLLDSPQPSDQPLPSIGKPTNGSDGSSVEGQKKQEEESLVKDGRRKEEGKGHKGKDARKGSISCSETLAETFSSPSPPKQDARWCEGDKAFPPKKRRGAFENATEDNNNNDVNNDKKNSKTKTKRIKMKMNKKCSRQDDSNEEDVENQEEAATKETKPEQANVSKKRVRGSALMEGSRCSRVNGRGWRCCQQTLVGYSLCEHHLGKGRLRSMTSVRNKSIGTTSVGPKNNIVPQSEHSFGKQTTKSSSSVTEEYPLGNDAENNDEKKPVIVTKRRMKLGMVKARSISSLLGQTNTEIVAIAEDNDNK